MFPNHCVEKFEGLKEEEEREGFKHKDIPPQIGVRFLPSGWE
jgi:hypothetical protein